MEHSTVWSHITEADGCTVFDSCLSWIGQLSGGAIKLLRPGQLAWRREYTKSEQCALLWEAEWIECKCSWEEPKSRQLWITDTPWCVPAASDSVQLVPEVPAQLDMWQQIAYHKMKQSASDAVNNVLGLIQGVLRLKHAQRPALLMFTHNVHAIPGCSTATSSQWREGTLWGLVRSVRSELPDLSLQCIDIAGERPHSTRDLQMWCERSELELVCSDNKWHALRLVNSKLPLVPSTSTHAQSSALCEPAVLRQQVYNSMQQVTFDQTLDVERISRMAAAHEALAKQFLQDAMKQTTFHHIQLDHHKKLWARWHSRLTANGQSTRLDEKGLSAEFPEIAGSLAMTTRSAFLLAGQPIDLVCAAGVALA